MANTPGNTPLEPASQRRLLRVRIIAGASALLILIGAIAFVDVNGGEDAMLVVIFLPPLALYAGILWSLRGGPRWRGLRLAMITGAAAAVLLSAIALFLLVTVVVVGISEPLGGDSAKAFAKPAGLAAGIALLAWMQGAMHQNAKRAHEAQLPEIELKQMARWIWALSILVGVGTLFLLAVSLPGLLRSRIAANESSAVGSLRTIPVAAASYSETYHNGYPPALNVLGRVPAGSEPTCWQADLIDATLASGTKSGYVFQYTPGPLVKNPVAGCPPGVENYTVSARPVTYGTISRRSFFTDQTHVVHFTREDRAATAADPPI